MHRTSLRHSATLSDVLDLSIASYRHAFPAWLRISALSQVPLGFLQVWYQPTLNAQLAALISPDERVISWIDAITFLFQNVGSFVIFFFMSVLLTAVTQAAIIHASLHLRTEQSPSIRHAYALGWWRYCTILLIATCTCTIQILTVCSGGLSGICAIMALEDQTTPNMRGMLFGASGLLVMLMLGGIYGQIRVQLAIPVSVCEQVGPIRAFRRSWQLTHRRMWRTIGFVSAITCGYYLCIFVPQNLIGYLLTHQTVILLVRYTSLVLATPMIALAYGMYYAACRIWYEGSDLEVQIHHVGRTTPLP